MKEVIRYEDIRLEPATNGYILRYCVVCKKEGQGEYDSCMHDYKQEVFEDANIDRAVTKMKALVNYNKGQEKADKNPHEAEY